MHHENIGLRTAFDPDAVAISAGGVMLSRLRELAARKATFAFETTLAGRRHAIWIRKLVRSGYEFDLIFLWLPTPELARPHPHRRPWLRSGASMTTPEEMG